MNLHLSHWPSIVPYKSWAFNENIEGIHFPWVTGNGSHPWDLQGFLVAGNVVFAGVLNLKSPHRSVLVMPHACE